MIGVVGFLGVWMLTKFILSEYLLLIKSTPKNYCLPVKHQAIILVSWGFLF